MKTSDIFVFCHIPKTAGTSLHYMLDRHFGTRKLDAIYRTGSKNVAYRPQDLRKDIKLYPNLQLLAGHSLKPFIDFEEFDNRMKWFTFLRNPIDRYLSHYRHQQTHSPARYKMELSDWARTYQRNNWMTKMIAGEENLQKAIDTLSTKFSFVGLQEQFGSSVEMLQQQFRWEGFDINAETFRMVSTPISGKCPDTPNPRVQYAELLQDENNLDTLLYDYCLTEIWPQQVERVKKRTTAVVKRSAIAMGTNRALAKLKKQLVYRPYIQLFEREKH